MEWVQRESAILALVSWYITLAVQYRSAQVASNKNNGHRRIFFRLKHRLSPSASQRRVHDKQAAGVGTRGTLRVGIVALSCPDGKHRPTADRAPIMTRQRGRVNPGGERLRA